MRSAGDLDRGWDARSIPVSLIAPSTMDDDHPGGLAPDVASSTHRRNDLLYSRNVLVLEMYQPDLPIPVPPLLVPLPRPLLPLLRSSLAGILQPYESSPPVLTPAILTPTLDPGLPWSGVKLSPLQKPTEHASPESHSTPSKPEFGEDIRSTASLALRSATSLPGQDSDFSVFAPMLVRTATSKYDSDDVLLSITQPVFHRQHTNTPTPLSNYSKEHPELSPIDQSIMKGLDDLDFKNLSHDDTFTKVEAVVSSGPTKRIQQCNDVALIRTAIKLPYDIYGFKKVSNLSRFTFEEYNQWFEPYAHYMIRRKQKWEQLLKHNGLNIDGSNPPQRFPPKLDKVKKLIRRGIPPEWRGNAWFFYAGGYEKLNKNVGVYDNIVRDTTGVQNKDTEVIERDLNRTFPDNIYFNDAILNELTTTPGNTPQSETAMVKALRRVLVAFAHYQPQIGYCQLLNFLAGLLLLFMDEERAFWMLVILTERIIPRVHSANLEGVHTDQGVLMLCVKEYIPTMWSMLGKTMEGEQVSEDKMLARLPPVTLVTSLWFMLLFVGILPIETVLRVWDIMWYEGSKTIFRISLTVCNMCLEQEKFRQSPANLEQIELFQFMQSYPKLILDPNLLIDNCFKKIGGYGFGSLSQDEINNCREFVQKQREKLNQRKSKGLLSEMTAEEQRSLMGDEDIHDIYGFNRSIMSGVMWNKHISTKMKKKFAMRKR